VELHQPKNKMILDAIYIIDKYEYQSRWHVSDSGEVSRMTGTLQYCQFTCLVVHRSQFC